MTAARKLNQMNEFENLICDKYRSKIDLSKIILSENLSPVEILELAITQKVSHVIQNGSCDVAKEMNTSALMIAQPNIFAKSTLSGILDPVNVGGSVESSFEIFKSDFSRANQKNDLLSNIESKLQLRRTSSSLCSDIMVIADELITNAVFNAPFVDAMNTLPGASRVDSTVHMSDGKQAQLFLGAGHDRLVIGVRDPFGKLNIAKLLTRVRNCYEKTLGATMNMTGQGGAGIGSFMVFNSSASYYAAVEKNQFTIVASSVPLKMSSRARQELPKNLHWVSSEKGEQDGTI